jgi:hypothetical protein
MVEGMQMITTPDPLRVFGRWPLFKPVARQWGSAISDFLAPHFCFTVSKRSGMNGISKVKDCSTAQSF